MCAGMHFAVVEICDCVFCLILGGGGGGGRGIQGP